jgi:hypothetical protein
VVGCSGLLCRISARRILHYQCLSDRFVEKDRRETARRIEIVFSFLVNHTDFVVFVCLFVWQRSIYLPLFKRRFISCIINTDNKPLTAIMIYHDLFSQIMLYFDISLADAVCFKPMNFAQANRSVRKFHLGDSLHFPPVPTPVYLFKSLSDLY